jgi:hypothetical protein
MDDDDDDYIYNTRFMQCMRLESSVNVTYNKGPRQEGWHVPLGGTVERTTDCGSGGYHNFYIEYNSTIASPSGTMCV